MLRFLILIFTFFFGFYYIVVGAEGLRDRVIGGGRPVTNPAWMVHITAGSSSCGGGFVSKEFVLTAANCFCTIFDCSEKERYG